MMVNVFEINSVSIMVMFFMVLEKVKIGCVEVLGDDFDFNDEGCLNGVGDFVLMVVRVVGK